MKKINWWIDPLMIPVILIGFLAGYIYASFVSGWYLAELTYDPEKFFEKVRILYGRKKSLFSSRDKF